MCASLLTLARQALSFEAAATARQGEGGGAAAAAAASALACDAMVTAVGDLRATLAAPVAVLAGGGGGGGGHAQDPSPSAHHLAAPGALRDAAALLSAFASAGPPADAAYEVPALLCGREPFVDWARSDVVARSALLGAALASADALARRAGAAPPASPDAASLAAASAEVATCVLGWVDALVSESGAAAGAAARLGPLGFTGPTSLAVGPLCLAPGDGADSTAAALRGLQIGDATLACHALDWAAARVGGGRGGGAGTPSALATALASPALIRPLDPSTPAHRAVRARAAAAVHALIASARSGLAAATGVAGRHGAAAPSLPPAILKVAHLVATAAVPALEAGLAGDYPLRRSTGWGGGGDAHTCLPGSALAAAAARPRQEGAVVADQATTLPPLPRPPPPAGDGLASTRATLLAEAHAFLVAAGLEPATTLLARAAAPYTPDRLWREPGAAAPYRSLAAHYAAVSLRVAPAAIFASPPALRPWLRFWLAALAEPGARTPVAGLTAALADSPASAWCFAGAGGACPADLLDEAAAPRARASLAASVLAAVRAREGVAGVSALVYDLPPVLAVRAREAAAARRARRWRGGAVGLLGAASLAAAPADAFRRPGPAGKSALDYSASMLAGFVGDAAADALDAAGARASRGAVVAASQGQGGGGSAAARAVPTPSDLASAAYGDAITATASLVLASGGVDGAPPGVVDALAALADGAAGRGGGRGGRGAGATPPAAAAALAAAAAAALAAPGPPAILLAHYLISGPLRRALEQGHTRPDGEAGDAGVGAARLVGALVCERGFGGGAALHALLPPALAPLLDALCPGGLIQGGPAAAAPRVAAAVVGALGLVARTHGLAALPPALHPADPAPPPPTSTLQYAGGPLATGGPLPGDRFEGAVAVFWRAALGAAAGVVVGALGGGGGGDAPSPPSLPLLTPPLARATRGDLFTLLGPPRPGRPGAAGLVSGGAGGGGGVAGAATTAIQGGSRPAPDASLPSTLPVGTGPDGDSPAAQAVAHADAAVAALGLAGDVGSGGRPGWAVALLEAVRPAVVGATLGSQPGPLAARILAAYDAAVDAVIGSDAALWARLARRGEGEGGDGATTAVAATRHPPPGRPLSTPAALAALPKGAALAGPLAGVWAVGPPLRRTDAAGKAVVALNMHWGGPGGPKAALVVWSGGDSLLAPALGGLALPSPVMVTGGLTVGAAKAVPILMAGPGTRVVVAVEEGVPRPRLRPAARAPRLPIAEAARSPPPPPPPVTSPEAPSSVTETGEEAVVEEEAAPAPAPPPHQPHPSPRRPPLAELPPAACVPDPSCPPANPSTAPPAPSALVLTPAACERLAAPLVAAGHTRPAALRALLVARARAAREDFLAGRPVRPPGADGEEALVRRALNYLMGTDAGGSSGGLVAALPPPPHNA